MSSKNNQKGIHIYTSKPWELIKTLFLVLTWIILGVHLEIVGPTLHILAKQVGVKYSGISTILITRGAGYMFGNIAGGLAQNIVKKHPEGLLSAAFLVAAVVILVTPLIHSLWLLSVANLLQGISQGVTDIGGTNLMLMMWGDHVSAPLNMVHLGFGVGAVAANLIIKPFLGEDIVKDSLHLENTTLPLEQTTSNIRVPYTITALLCVVIAVGHFFLSLREYRAQKASLQNPEVDYKSVSTANNDDKKETEPESEQFSQYSPRSCGNGYLKYGLSMSVVWTCYMFFVSGNDLSFGKFFFAFLKSPDFNISAQGANIGMIIYWFSYSLGRLICAIATMFVPVHIALSCLWGCGLLLAITWYIYVWVIGLNSVNLFVLGGLTGLAFSPTFPLSFGFINQRLSVNPFLVSIFLCGSALGGMTFQKIGGVILDHESKHFPSLLITCVIMTTTLFIVAFIISSMHKRNLDKKQKSMPIADNKNVLMVNEEQQMEAYLKTYDED